MDGEPPDPNVERGDSSESRLARPNPFEDDDGVAPRKRVRLSQSTSRSSSSDVNMEKVEPERTPALVGQQLASEPSTPSRPQTPEPISHIPNKVTLNLRSPRAIKISMSPTSPQTPQTPIEHTNTIVKDSIEPTTGDDDISSMPAISSSDSGEASPPVVLVIDDDPEGADDRHDVILVEDDSTDPLDNFPGTSTSTSIETAVQRIAEEVELGSMSNGSIFREVTLWMENFLAFYTSHYSVLRSLREYREFWLKFPDIVFRLNRRKLFFGEWLNKNNVDRQNVSQFFSSLAALTARIITSELADNAQWKVSDSSKAEPVFISRRFLTALSSLLKQGESHIGSSLVTHYEWDWDYQILQMNKRFIAGRGLESLIQHSQNFLDMASISPQYFEMLVIPTKILGTMSIEALDHPAQIISIVTQKANAGNDRKHHAYPLELAAKILNESWSWYSTMSKALDVIIEKHVTLLSPDSALIHFEGLSSILGACVSYDGGPSPAKEVIIKQQTETKDLCPKYLVPVVTYRWRIRILKKLITSGQMQLRVIGVSSMCADLLTIFQTYKRDGEPCDNKFLLYVAGLIAEHRLVGYIVGTGSHPELIGQSGNIIGFLVVARTYTSQNTDTIWHTVTNSQDPRIVEATLRMLGSVVNLLDLDHLFYLCSKLATVHLDSFGAPMRELCDQVLNHIIAKSARDNFIGAAPYELCVHLIRGSSGYRSNASPLIFDVHALSTKKFQELLQFGPHPDVRKRIYATCIEDIGSRSDSAPGSICLLSIMVDHVANDLTELVLQHGLTDLLVEEYAFAVKEEADPHHIHTTNDQTFQMRRDLLFKIICNFPSSISSLTGPKLWSLLVGEDARSPDDRQIAWKLLNSLATRLPNMNSFINACVHTFLPMLPPHCFTEGCLDFVKLALQRELRVLQSSSPESFQEILGLKQLWRIALTSLDGTVDLPAVNLLIEVYLEAPATAMMSPEETQRLHADLVERSLDRLAATASKLTQSEELSLNRGAIDLSSLPQINVHVHELSFRRSLTVLRGFLDEYQKRFGRDAPPLKAPAADQDPESVGDKIKVHYQAFDGNKHTGMESCEIGLGNSAGDLFAKLSRAVGFDEYSVYYSGVRLRSDKVNLCKTLEELHMGSLPILLHRQENVEAMSRGVVALENIIKQRFQELWSFLNLPLDNAREIYNFLIRFPIYGQLLAAFESGGTAISDVFPSDQIYKGLYALHALQIHMEKLSGKRTLDEKVRGRMFMLVSTAFGSSEVMENCPNEVLRVFYEYRFVECLSQLLRDFQHCEGIAIHLKDTGLLRRLLQILTGARVERESKHSLMLIAGAFGVILRASMHSVAFWNNFKASDQVTLFRRLLLEEDQSILREEVAKRIINVCKATPIQSAVSDQEFATKFWQAISPLIPIAVMNPLKCHEFFSLALAVFKRMFELDTNTLEPRAYLSEWGTLLVKHDVIQFVGRPGIVDKAVIGLSKLVHWCVLAAKARKRELGTSTLALDLFNKHLFPPLTQADSPPLQNLPLLDTQTRSFIYDTVLLLTKEDFQQWRSVMVQVSDLVAYDYRKGEYSYEALPLMYERDKQIRSSTGYVGLRNLSNTCYLNSLFTQLFMNVSFRDFMLRANVADGNGTQRLLHETQNLFSYMQNSYFRSVEPSALACSIKTYEETRIDVNIQMDVDEFYNLLFDRWEGQILAPEAKAEFRSFYGGQLVQQVKSKECPHISERLEPFSAIQCDIKGKSTLEESLQAYVDGEIMEGDNKYKCSTCDRHVDAVKRACLKDVPDNLIFHLKRFDFNLRTLQRNKINDHFAFPRTIDMRPYKVDHLMSPSEDSPEDIFELVGILVHTGTAESGHYYSYIRERPSYDSLNTWVEFNDDTVVPFDPALIESNCFGGPDYRSPTDNGNFHFDKVWSAYMLFYQRSSSIKSQQQALQPAVNLGPVHVPVAAEVARIIDDENEEFLRKHCLYDPNHAPFVAHMFENMFYINQDTCSPQHTVENQALEGVLNHFNQVVTRAAEANDVTNYFTCLLKAFRRCALCAYKFLQWIVRQPDALRSMLLRSPEILVRGSIAQLIVNALESVDRDTTSSVDTDDSDGSVEELRGIQGTECFAPVATAVFKLFDYFHQHTRAWPEFFQLLINMASKKSRIIWWLDQGLLYKLLNIVTADPNLELTPQLSKMLNILSRKNASRTVSWDSLIALLDLLLRACDLGADTPVGDDKTRDIYLQEPQVPINRRELQVITLHWTESEVNVLLEKLLNLNSNNDATQSIVKQILEMPDQASHVENTIVHGLRRRATLPIGPYLRAASTYCETVNDMESIFNMADAVTRALNMLDYEEAKDFLQFYKTLHRLYAKDGFSRRDYIEQLLRDLIAWAPQLLLRATPEVHADTEDFLRDELFSKLEEADVDKPKANEAAGEPDEILYAETVRRLGVMCLQYLDEFFVIPRKQPIKSSLVSIRSIIEACKPSFELDPEVEDDDDEEWTRLYGNTMSYLERFAVEEAEDAASEWDDSQSMSSGHFETLEYVADALMDPEAVY